MSLPLIVAPDLREVIYDDLMANRIGHANDHVLAQVLSTWANGGGALPVWLGLEQGDFQELCDSHFNGTQAFVLPVTRLETERAPERDDLRDLLLNHRAGEHISELWLADIVVAACMGMDHLWQDLGVWSRRELSALLKYNFPALAAKNTHDMKWKKFFYKQLCAQEGIYICRAPSCEVCVDYNKCFGPED